jgi:hypothetical protein
MNATITTGSRWLVWLALTPLLALAPACGSDEGDAQESLRTIQAELNQAERMARYTQIRDAASTRGIDRTAYLLAGIAYAETGLAHCWSEATWACQGPASADCGNGPVIAGAGDGPCSTQQGGLGMFQFDAGTYSQTLDAYGAHVLTVAGNVSQAIDYVVNMVKISAYTTNAETDAKALAWLNNFDIHNAALRDQWIKTVTHYYNGCKPEYSCWSQRYGHYNDSLQYVVDETGLPFWVSDQLPHGWLDSVGCDAVSGWAQDADDPSAAIDVHLYFGGPAGSGAVGVPTNAGIHRDDLCDAIGSCTHGFAVASPLSFFDGQPHAVHAYGMGVSGGGHAELAGSPTNLNCAATLPKGIRRHVINPDSFAAWRLDGFFDQLPVAESDVSSLSEGEDLPAVPALVKADDGSPEVWVVDGEFRRHVPGPEVMAGWRFDWEAIQSRPAAEVNALEVGPPWRGRPVLVSSEGAIWLVDDPFPEPEGDDPVTPGEQGGAGGGPATPETSTGGASAATGGSAGAGVKPGESETWWATEQDEDAGSCSLAPTSRRTRRGGSAWLLLAGVCCAWALRGSRRRGRKTLALSALSSVLLVGCGAADPEENFEDPGPIAQVASALDYDCTVTQGTGYDHGTPFAIELVTVEGFPVELHTADALLTMMAAAEKDGVDININDAFRTYAEQEYFYNCYVNCSCNGCNPAAAPGYSNHQSGHAIDFDMSGSAYAWIFANAPTYGWSNAEGASVGEDWHWTWWGGGTVHAYCADAAPQGWLDSAGCEVVSGWAQDPDEPSTAIDVHLYFGGPAGSGAVGVPTNAGIHRDDLCDAIGSCTHGFAVASPLSLFDGQPHAVHAYGMGVSGGGHAELAGSPANLNCAATLPKGVRRHVINPDSFAAWRLDGFFDQLPVAESEVSSLSEGGDLPAVPALVKADDGSPEVWVVDGDFRRHVPGPEVMAGWRFDWEAIQSKPAAEVNALEVGPPWRGRPVLVSSEGAIWLVDDPFPEPEGDDPVTPGEQGGAGGGPATPETSTGGASAATGGSAGAGAEPGEGETLWAAEQGEEAGSCSVANTSRRAGRGASAWLLLAAVSCTWALRGSRRGGRTALPQRQANTSSK